MIRALAPSLMAVKNGVALNSPARTGSECQLLWGLFCQAVFDDGIHQFKFTVP